MSAPHLMTIGEVAQQAGVTVKTVRLYDALGLVQAADRTAGNFRLFNREAVVWVERVKRLQRLGMSLTEIRDMLTIYRRSADA